MIGKQAKKTIVKLDMFSLPFQFSLGNDEKEKRTLFGGVLSLIIMSVSSAYFVYLCYLYFSNKVQPSIAITHEDQQTSYTMKLDSNFISLQIILQNGQTLYDYQNTTGKVYLNLLTGLNLGGTNRSIQLYPLIPCQNASLKGYMCIDYKSLSGGNSDFELIYTPGNIEKYNVNLIFSYCNPMFLSSGQSCATVAEINSLLLTYSTQINLRLELQQYNTQLQKYENRVKIEPFYFDNNLVFYTKVNLQKYEVTVNQGLIIQSQDQSTFFGDYLRKDTFSSQTFVDAQMGFNMLGGIIFFIGQESVSTVYQFAQFPSLLAQFTSVFNTLLYLGFFCKLFAQSEIVHSIIDMQLKVYFKKTRLFLIENYGNKKEVQIAKSEGVFRLWSYLQNINLKLAITKKLNLSLFQKIKLIMFEEDPKKKQDEDDNKIDEVEVFKSLREVSANGLNIFAVQKELLQIKLMLRLILSVEQYAAMQLCGSSVPYCVDKQIQMEKKNQEAHQDIGEEDNSTQKIQSAKKTHKHESAVIFPLQQQIDEGEVLDMPQNIDKNYTLNHLEQIDLIERDQDLFSSYIDKFLHSNSHHSEVDKRIMQCMIGLSQPKSTEDINVKQ